LKRFIAGLIAGIMITAGTTYAFAESTMNITVIFDRIKLVVDGTPISQQTLLYNGTTYVPLRAAAEALGKAVGYDAATNTAYIGKQPQSSTGSGPAATDGALLRKVLSQNTAEPIQEFYVDDFDMDGANEVFAITGDVNGSSDYDFCVWFVTQSGASKIEDHGNLYAGSSVADLGSQKLMIVEGTGGGSDSFSMAWAVENEQARELTHTGQDLTYANGEFTTALGAFDYSKMDGDDFFTGHTWKRYYLYWDKTDFKEYGGIKISMDQFLSLPGAQGALSKVINSGEQIGDIYFRGNGIININVSSTDGGFLLNENRTLRLVNGTVTIPEYSADDGWYAAAAFPDAATYMSFDEIVRANS